MKNRQPIIIHYATLLLALLMLGSAIWVFIVSHDATDLHPELMFLLGSAVLFWFFFRFDYPDVRHIHRVSRLSKCGVPARAKVISVELTGRYLNEQPQLAYTLAYNHPKTGQRVRGVTREYTTLLDLPAAQTGDMLPILFDPDAPEEIIIDKKRIRPRNSKALLLP